jgi:hypothetical protein
MDDSRYGVAVELSPASYNPFADDNYCAVLLTPDRRKAAIWASRWTKKHHRSFAKTATVFYGGGDDDRLPASEVADAQAKVLKNLHETVEFLSSLESSLYSGDGLNEAARDKTSRLVITQLVENALSEVLNGSAKFDENAVQAALLATRNALKSGIPVSQHLRDLLYGRLSDFLDEKKPDDFTRSLQPSQRSFSFKAKNALRRILKHLRTTRSWPPQTNEAE